MNRCLAPDGRDPMQEALISMRIYGGSEQYIASMQSTNVDRHVDKREPGKRSEGEPQKNGEAHDFAIQRRRIKQRLER